MQFANGILTHCQIESPMDVVNVLNSDVQILEFEEIMQKAVSYLEMSDSTDDLHMIYTVNSARSEAIVDEVEFGLVRTRIKNNEEDFYLVPAYTLRGIYRYYDQSESVIHESEEYTFVTVNAVDGSIINTQLGY